MKILDSATRSNLSGEWELFYNRWIVTESDDNQPDGMIRLPGRWTGMEVGGKNLPKTGYASYRLTVQNCKLETLLAECSNIANVAYCIYIEGS